MKKLLCVLLALLFTLSFCACGGDEPDVSSDASSEDTVAESSEEEPSSQEESSEKAPVIPTINGSPISDFVIVYPNTTEEATYLAAATELQKSLKDAYGVELTVQSDYEDEVEKEIIVGNSNYRSVCSEHNRAFDYGEYSVVITGTKLLVMGSYATGCYQGIKALMQKLGEAADGALTDLSFEGKGSVVKVACVGDSITHGINSTDPDLKIYPHYLQDMLGLDYYVMNAGITDRSICSTDIYNYASTIQHVLALEMKPDVVIFILGSNDANPAHDYKSWTNPDVDRKAIFLQSANALLDEYVAANPDVQIYLGIPSSPFKLENDKWNADGWKANLVEYVIPLLKQIAESRSLPTVDLYTWSLDHPEVFVDGLHPKDETYKVFAEYIYETIKESIKQP